MRIITPLAGLCACVLCGFLAAGLLGCSGGESSSTSTGGAGSGGGAIGGGPGFPAGAGGSGGVATGDGGTASGAGGAGGSAGSGSTPGTGAAAGTGGGGSGLVPGNTMDCGAVAPGAASVRLEAECAHGSGCPSGVTGTQQGTVLENGGTTVGYVEGGDLLGFHGVSLDGVTTAVLRYAKETAGGTVELRLDSPTGALLGSAAPQPTGGWSSWQEMSLSLSGATGTHAVYVVATGSTEGILNIDWLTLSGEGGTSSGGASAFHLNHLGFATLGPKHAVAEGPAGLDRFYVVDVSGDAVWCGDLAGEAFTAWGSSSTFYSVDFTELTLAGTYRLQVGSSLSDPFVVGDARLSSQTLSSVIGYFRSSRADDPDVWAADASVRLEGSTRTADVRGGWYDASGDISKYLTHLSYANFLNPQQIPLVAWALAFAKDEGGASVAQSAAVQEEALWGADYLLRVLDPAGYFYIGVFDGWSGMLGARSICAFEGSGGSKTSEYQSALREGGGMSIAALARIAAWGVAGSFSSAEYLAGAERAFAHLDTNGKNYADDQRENVIDDYAGLLAAAELFAATNDAKYLDAARRRATSLIGRLSPTGYFIADGGSRPFWHASDAGLPVVALARYVEVETDAAARAGAQSAIRAHIDYLLRVTGEVPNPYGYARQHTGASASFFIPHTNETGYWWQGENARLASLAAAAMIGGDAVGASGADHLALLRFAGKQIDWVLGNNPFDVCFMHGFGRNNPPPYATDPVKPQVSTFVGGIANGITGGGSGGIQWMGGTEAWEQWRWIEQWLPHAAWYLVALTALEGS